MIPASIGPTDDQFGNVFQGTPRPVSGCFLNSAL
jgi:hypothetical protein